MNRDEFMDMMETIFLNSEKWDHMMKEGSYGNLLAKLEQENKELKEIILNDTHAALESKLKAKKNLVEGDPK